VQLRGAGKSSIVPAQARMRLAGTGVSESDDILQGGDISNGPVNERLVERWNGGKVERVETFHRRKAGGAEAALDHAPFAIDAFELGETKEEADMIEPLTSGFGGDFFIFAEEGRQFELPQMIRESRSHIKIFN
jgi:hypothetical protein